MGERRLRDVCAYNMAIPLGKKQANILETWLKKIASYQEGFGIESPAISLPFHEGLGEHLLPVHIGFSGRSDGEGTIAWDSEFSFGAALRGNSTLVPCMTARNSRPISRILPFSWRKRLERPRGQTQDFQPRPRTPRHACLPVLLQRWEALLGRTRFHRANRFSRRGRASAPGIPQWNTGGADG